MNTETHKLKQAMALLKSINYTALEAEVCAADENITKEDEAVYNENCELVEELTNFIESFVFA